MRLARLATTGLVTGGLLLGAVACGGDSTGSESAGAAPAPAASAPAPATTPSPAAQIAALKGTDTAVEVDPAVLQAITGLGVKVAPTGTGKLTMEYGPTLEFPITGGNVTVYPKGSITPYVQGKIDHEGSGISFTGAGKTLTVQNFVVDPGTSKLMAQVKEMDNAEVPLFDLDGTDLQITMDEQGRAKLDGTKVKLTPEAAQALNTTFGVQNFMPGMQIGIAHITAN
jgi:hypothetical protein